VRAADDPSWTPEQLAAARIVDTYYDVLTQIYADPAGADMGQLTKVASGPQYTADVNAVLSMVARGWSWVGDNPGVIPVSRTVSPVATVDDQREIHVTQCQVDNPNGHLFENGSPVDQGNPEEVYDYTIQWVDAQQDWRIVDEQKVSDGC
jgi:hypothetical protein